jgi:uncharacterized membrane protein
MRLARSVLIDAPARRVWALVDDDRNLSLWMPLVVGTRYPDGSAGGKTVGTRFIQTLRDAGPDSGQGGGATSEYTTSEYAGEVTQYKPGQVLGLRLLPQAFTVDVRYYVTHDPDYDRTRLVYICDTRANSWSGWAMMMLGAKMLGRIADQQLAGIKRAAESSATMIHGIPKGQQTS